MLVSSLIFIHGLNNNPEVLKPLANELCQKNIECHHIILPGHTDADREITKDTTKALKSFNDKIAQVTNTSYNVIAFSQGALYFENYLESNPEARRPNKAIYFAPAFYIKKQSMISFATWLLPDSLKIPSYAPLEIRQFPSLYVYDYKNLINLMKIWQDNFSKFKQPTLILADKEDELVKVENLQSLEVNFELIKRSKVKKRAHHLVVHPNFYEQKEWARMIDSVKTFLINH